MKFLLGFCPLTSHHICSRISLMRQFASMPPSFRGFGQPQSQQVVSGVNEESEDLSDEGSYNQATSRSTGRPFPSTQRPSFAPAEAKVGINPFPEETTNNYYSPTMFPGASEIPFPKEITDILQSELNPDDVEIKPDGAVYLPESRYRKILCRAFGAGGWCIVPRGAHSLSSGVLSREYALYCSGRYISQARGHANIQGFSNPAMASEVVRSNALMRVCKDIGIGNELWDPAYCSNWRATYAVRKIDNGKYRWNKRDQQAQ